MRSFGKIETAYAYNSHRLGMKHIVFSLSSKLAERTVSEVFAAWEQMTGKTAHPFGLAEINCHSCFYDEKGRISLFGDIPNDAYEGCIVMPPVRLFKDAYSHAFLAYAKGFLKRGGLVLLPYQDPASKQDAGLWDLEWLRRILGQELRVDTRKRLALFRHEEPMAFPASVFSAFAVDWRTFAAKFFAERDHSGSASYLERCRDFLHVPKSSASPSLQAAEESLPDLQQGATEFLACATYSATGAAYKTAALRHFFHLYLPRKKELRVVNIGGGMGFVDIELLLTSSAVAQVTNCEPIAASLPVTRALFEYYRDKLVGRYRFALAAAQDYRFDEPCDMVCDFAALLYVPRDQLQTTLDRAWDSLRPGGILVIHENIRRPIFLNRPYYNLVFTAEELEILLRRYGAIDYYRSSDFQLMARKDIKDLTVFRVVQKGT